jgi:DNA (cytosine-5)-methyltransferase 1
MRLLDLFCGAGGAAMGYHRAGFDEIVGVDIKPQPRYPFTFVLGDALEYVREHGREFDAIHASPPCQAYSVMRALKHRREHPDLIETVRNALVEIGRPFVIENVPGAPLRNALTLCGSLFGLRSHRGYLRRHRLFEVGNTDVLILTPPCHHQGVAIGVYGHGSAGLLGQRMRTANRDEARVLMGTPEMHRDGMSQAIPPAYTEFIGRQLMSAVHRDHQPGARRDAED